jgi:uncharacterized pyridoxamine 5'-phosphate oxidase family protein
MTFNELIFRFIDNEVVYLITYTTKPYFKKLLFQWNQLQDLPKLMNTVYAVYA